MTGAAGDREGTESGGGLGVGVDALVLRSSILSTLEHHHQQLPLRKRVLALGYRGC